MRRGSRDPSRRARQMKKLLLAAGLLLSSPALADEVRFFQCDDPCLAEIHYTNLATDAGDVDQTFLLPDGLGVVELRSIRVPNYFPDPDDTVEVLSVPEGMAAVPYSIKLPEDTTGVIRLFRYEGM